MLLDDANEQVPCIVRRFIRDVNVKVRKTSLSRYLPQTTGALARLRKFSTIIPRPYGSKLFAYGDSGNQGRINIINRAGKIIIKGDSVSKILLSILLRGM